MIWGMFAATVNYTHGREADYGPDGSKVQLAYFRADGCGDRGEAGLSLAGAIPNVRTR